MTYYVITKSSTKKYINDFFQKTNYYLKKRMVICKKYRYKTKKSQWLFSKSNIKRSISKLILTALKIDLIGNTQYKSKAQAKITCNHL